MTMTVSDFFLRFGNSIKSIVKVALKSRCCRFKKLGPEDGELIVMANGPSLNTTMTRHMETLKTHHTMSVNFAPLSEAFRAIRPKFHVIADPLFFSENPPENVALLYTALSSVDWPLTIFVPRERAKNLPPEIAANPNIKIQRFNFVGAEGFSWLTKFLYDHKLAMPRPRNVLVPAIMCGIWMGYKDVYIVGADHSWMQTISVDENNNVISVQPHFYADSKNEQKRIDNAYRNYKLHQIVHSFYVAFRSYHTLARYAKKARVDIFNSTPASFIDAFPRKPLPK